MFLPISRTERGYYPSVNNVWRVFDRMLDDFNEASETRSMATDILEREEEYIITAELPGLEKKDVKIKVEKNQLIIEAEIEQEKEDKDKEKNWIRKERYLGSYRRSFALSDSCDTEKITAAMDKGILHVHIPKSAPSLAREIEIK